MGRILAVDDDPLARAVLTDVLRALGHSAVVVGSGAEALARLDEAPYDLVIADVVMPDPDGVALARRCAARTPPVPVALTSARRPELTGVPNAGFLPKPLDADRLGRFLDAFYAAAKRPPAPPPDSWSGADFLRRVSGPVEEFPPVRVLFLAHRVGASGALRVERDGITALVGVRAGKIVQVLGVPGLLAALGPGVPDARDLARDLAGAVGLGHPADQALQLASDRLGAWLAALGDAPGGTVSFDTGWVAPPGAFPLPEPVPRLLARGLVRARTDAVVARTWSALGEAGIQLRLPDDAPDTTWGLDAVALRVVRLVGRARTVGRLVALAEPPQQGEGPVGGPRRTELYRALDTLRALGLLVVDGGALAKPAMTPKPVDATQEDSRVSRLAAALQAMEGAHPVEVLELTGRARLTDEHVANAYRDISRRYHPDLYYNAPPAVRGLAEACFAAVNAAYDALRGPGGLGEARRYQEARTRGEAYVSEKDHLNARVAFRRAEALFRGRDYAGAAPHFAEAARLDGRTWPHALYAAWCGWLAKQIPAAEALAQLDAIGPPDAIRAAEVLVHTATILKQEGRADDAIVRFRAALEKDPTNRDAQREIRLHEQRNPPKPPAPFSGLLGKKRE